MIEKIDCNKHKWIPLLGINKGKSVPTSLFTCLICGDLRVGAQTIKISQYRLDMGGLPIKSVSTVGINESLTSDHTASGIIMSMTAGEALAFGDIVYFKSDAKVYKADATGGASKYPAMGMAIASISNGVAGDILLHGTARDDNWTWTVGGLIYLSKTAGAMTQDYSGYGANDVIQVLGIATHANASGDGIYRIYFNPSRDYLTHV